MLVWLSLRYGFKAFWFDVFIVRLIRSMAASRFRHIRDVRIKREEKRRIINEYPSEYYANELIMTDRIPFYIFPSTIAFV